MAGTFDFDSDPPQLITPPPDTSAQALQPVQMPPRGPATSGATPGVLSDFQLQPPKPKSQPQTPSNGVLDFDTNSVVTGQQPPPSNEPKAYGSILPISQGQNGQWGFDPRGGFTGQLAGAVTNAFSMPYDVTHGRMPLDNPQAAGRSLNAALSTAAGGDMAASETTPKPPIPSAVQLKGAGSDARDVANSLGVLYDLGWDGQGGLAGQLRQSLGDKDEIVAGQTHRVIDKIQANSDDPVSLARLDNYRKTLRRIAYSPGQTAMDERSAAKQAISGIDQFVENTPSQAVLAGDTPVASQLYNYARANETQAFKDDKIQGKGAYAGFKQNGSNYDTALKNQISPLFLPGPNNTTPRLSGFFPDEKQALGQVVSASGQPVRQLTRAAAAKWPRMLEGAESVAAGLEGYHAYGWPGVSAALVPPAIGGSLRYGSNKMAQNSLDRASELIRSNSPLYQQRLQNASPMALQPNAPGIAAIRAADVAAQPQQEQQYAKGGRIKSTHQRLVSRLMSLAEKAQKAGKAATKPILNVPDDTVTTALARANEAI